MKAHKVLLVDIDDTLIYWSKHYTEWFYKNNFENGKTFDTHDLKFMFDRTNFEPFNQSEDFLKRDPITPIYNFVKECFEQGDITVIFTSACGTKFKENQKKCITNLFPADKYHYGIHICDHAIEKVEMINKLLTTDRIIAILLDDKRVTNSNVKCYATDSKDINHLRSISNLLWRVKPDERKKAKNYRR